MQEAFRIGVRRRRGGGGRRLAPGEVDVLVDVSSTEHLLGRMTIMLSAQDPDVCRVPCSAERPRMPVIELEKRARRAALAVVADERATQAVARCDLPACGSRHVARLRWGAIRAPRRGAPRARSETEPLLF